MIELFKRFEKGPEHGDARRVLRERDSFLRAVRVELFERSAHARVAIEIPVFGRFDRLARGKFRLFRWVGVDYFRRFFSAKRGDERGRGGIDVLFARKKEIAAHVFGEFRIDVRRFDGEIERLRISDRLFRLLQLMKPRAVGVGRGPAHNAKENDVEAVEGRREKVFFFKGFEFDIRSFERFAPQNGFRIEPSDERDSKRVRRNLVRRLTFRLIRVRRGRVFPRVFRRAADGEKYARQNGGRP